MRYMQPTLRLPRKPQFVRIASPIQLAVAVAVVLIAPAALGALPALTISGGNSTVGHGENSATTMGWRFDVGSSITVTALGYFDDLGNGLAESHEVGIFDATGSLLASASVPAGDAGRLVDSFRYATIAKLVLTPGPYTIGGTIGADASDPAIYEAFDPVTVTGISLPADSSRYTEAGSYTSLTYPDLHWPAANLYLGPNFLVTSIPEPAAVWLLLAGLVALRLRAPRRQ